ncbi:hypothetical protein B0O99DRAFT_225188 [Bisporella sp. PMI_857]|nr:hypothetical protein B0O99DRAFT_225188 [Bisporella sp. PMI_857]
MTERPLSITTQVATPIQTALNSTGSVSAHDDAQAVAQSIDEEDYTIKCICEYDDDDGETVFCEKCETWQHIDCFYPGRVEDARKADFDHFCIDCNPRQLDLDKDQATERQRRKRYHKAFNDTGDRRKRPTSKNHKKKSKPADLQVNGYHGRDGHSPHDQQPHTKKSKGHRSTQSINSHTKHSPSYNARQTSHGLPPSPAHTPPDLPRNIDLHGYSDHFAALYDNDEAFEETETSQFASLDVSNTLSEWLSDPQKLLRDVGKEDINELTVGNIKSHVGNFKPHQLLVNETLISDNERDFRCKYLVAPREFREETIVGELSGLVGFQRDLNDVDKPVGYPHPLPFIFYVPAWPLFIDTRREGSLCRYVRRSCRPNTNLGTAIGRGQGSPKYHFWLISERPIATNEQITIPWDFRFPKKNQRRYLHHMNLLHDEEVDREQFERTPLSDEEFENLSGTIHQILSDYGGCACGLGNNCAFARFHQSYHGRLQSQSNGVKSKKGRKPKQNHVSPTGTGHATNSRAASEGRQDQYDDQDHRSVSGSSRSKPNSRDLTPIHGVGEINGMGVITEREKRKVLQAEATFAKMEQAAPPRKKKRLSDSATVQPTSPATSKPRQKSVAPRPSTQSSNTNGARKPQYVDASTSRRQSISPYSAVTPNTPFPPTIHQLSRGGVTSHKLPQASTDFKPSYTDSSTQTENEDNVWYSSLSRVPTPKRAIVPLSKRLLRNRHNIRLERQTQQQIAELRLAVSPTVPMDLDGPAHEDRYPADSPTDSRGRRGSIASSTPSVETSASADVTMTDSMIGSNIKPPPPPWPAQSGTSGPHTFPPQRSPELRVQMPPTPSFSIPNMSGGPPGSATPSSATGSVLQSPFVNGLSQIASPVKTKKKMSFSDYKLKNARKTEGPNKSSAGSSPTVASATLKQPLSTIDEASAPGVLEAHVPLDRVISEKKLDPIDIAIVSSELKSPRPSEEPNGIL